MSTPPCLSNGMWEHGDRRRGVARPSLQFASGDAFVVARLSQSPRPLPPAQAALMMRLARHVAEGEAAVMSSHVGQMFLLLRS